MRLFQLLTLFLVILISGCSGGGSVTSATGADDVDPNNPPADAVHTLDLGLFDCPDPNADTLDGCAVTDNFDASSPAVIRVLAQRDGEIVAGELVTVEADKGTLIPSDGRVLTGNDGTALLQLLAGTNEGLVLVSGTYLDGTDSFFATINNVDVDLALSVAALPSGGLADGSTIAVTATLTSDGQPYTDPATVNFSSDCSTEASGEEFLASIDQQVAAVDGVAISTYKPTGCDQQDTVTATLTLGTNIASDTVVIPIAETPVASIQFESASPELLQLDGTGGDSASVITFQVLDESDRPKQGVDVLFSFASGEDKFEITPTSARTDVNGEVTVTLLAGSLPGSARIKAEVANSDPVITTVSQELAIGTGLPDKNSFSLSFSAFNPEAWRFDGVTVDVTIRAADHFNNPVPDGTTVSFITEGGAIGSSCSTNSGACSVVWTSQDFRPDNGRVTVLAFAEGEETFIDRDGDGVFDVGEYDATYDEHEPYLNNNEDGSNLEAADGFDDGEQLIDRDGNGAFDDADGQYNGILCPGSLNGSACSQELVDVNTSNVIVFSGRAPLAYFCRLDSAEPFTDDNNNGIYDVSEAFFDRNLNGDYDGADLDGDGVTGFDCWDNVNNVFWEAVSYEDDVPSAAACVVDIAFDGETLNPVPVGTSINFSADDPLQTSGRASSAQLSTNAAVYHVSNEAEVLTDVRSSCGLSLYTVGVDTSEGIGTLRVEVATPAGIIALDSVDVLNSP